MTPAALAQEPSGSTASTNAKAALGLRLTLWTGILCGIGFVYCMAQSEKTGLAENILISWLAFLAAFLGLNMVQRKNDRDSDYGALSIKAGAPSPTVIKEVTKTTTQATSEKNTVAPPTQEEADGT